MIQPGFPVPLTLTPGQMYFPCFPAALRYRVIKDPVTGMGRVVDTGLGPKPAGWNWAVCHAGSWIHRRHHYVWVVGHKRHHIAPLRWVKSGHRVAFVPLHPYDVKGRPPINRKEEVFEVKNKNGISVERVKFEPGHPIEELKSAPREYRSDHMPPLSRTGVPHMEAYAMKDGLRGGHLAAVKGVPLGFNSKLQSFTMSKEVMHGSRTVTVSAPITNRGGTLQARGGSFTGGHGGFSSRAVRAVVEAPAAAVRTEAAVRVAAAPVAVVRTEEAGVEGRVVEAPAPVVAAVAATAKADMAWTRTPRHQYRCSRMPVVWISGRFLAH